MVIGIQRVHMFIVMIFQRLVVELVMYLQTKVNKKYVLNNEQCDSNIFESQTIYQMYHIYGTYGVMKEAIVLYFALKYMN